MLLGIITGCNFFSFLSKVESETADRIDWNTFQGRVEDPYPPDVWIEGNNGYYAMRVNYKGTRTEFVYVDDFTNDQGEYDTIALATAVIAHLERSIAADPDPTSGALTAEERRQKGLPW
jgi:hypothetical protein